MIVCFTYLKGIKLFFDTISRYFGDVVCDAYVF